MQPYLLKLQMHSIDLLDCSKENAVLYVALKTAKGGAGWTEFHRVFIFVLNLKSILSTASLCFFYKVIKYTEL